MLHRFSNVWLSMVTQRPKLLLSLILIVLLAAIAGLPNFKLDASSESLTLENDQDLDFFRKVIKNYGSGDFLVITFRPEVDLFSDQSLATLQRLQDDLSQVDGVSNINSILNVPLLFSPTLSLREVAQEPRTLMDADTDRALAKKEFLLSPIYKNMILGPDGQTTALQLNLAVDTHYLDLVFKRDELRALKRSGEITNAQEKELAKVSEEFLAYRTQADAKNRHRVELIRDVVSSYKSDAQIYLGGITMITADMISFIRKDLVVFGSAVVAFMAIVLGVIFRRIRFVVIPMATCLTAVTLMLGLISWLDWRLTVISSNFVALLLIISLAIIIHLVVRYREYSDANPDWTQAQLVQATLKFMALPCFYTALTTIVAFVSLVVSDIRPVIDFGWMMTMGLTAALILAFILMPASLMLLKREPARRVNAEKSESKPLTLYCSAIVEKHGGGVLIVSAIIAALSVWGISRLQVENKFVDYFREDTEIHQGLSIIDQELGGTTSLDIIIDAAALDFGDAILADDVSADDVSTDNISTDNVSTDNISTDNVSTSNVSNDKNVDAVDGIDAADEKNQALEEFEEFEEFDEFGGGDDAFADVEDEFGDDPFGNDQDTVKTSTWMTLAGLETLEDLHDYLETLPEVGKVSSLATLYKVGKEINGSLNNFELAVLEKSLPPSIAAVLMNPYLDRESDQARITLRIVDTYPGLQRKELVERIRGHIDSMEGLHVESVRFSGLLVLYNNMLQSLFSSQIVTLGAVFLGIMLMFMILFQSIKIAIVAIIPNMLAALSIIGGMGLAGIPLDMMTITIAAITVGIGVDDTIHYIHRFKTELKVDGDYIAAMHRSHGSIGRAMYYTSVIIIFGFSIMVLSEFIPTIYFGLLTGVAMLAALAGALFLLPKLILMSRPFKVSVSEE